jgi:uncharacterized membrane protein YeaQ/YmgE (transglycosylase-associated protein family)
MTAALVILVVLWVILGLVAAALAPRIFKKPAPFGLTAEYVICVVTALAVGLLDWLVFLPMFNITGPLAFVGALVEPFLSAWLVIWILRQVKQTPPA